MINNYYSCIYTYYTQPLSTEQSSEDEGQNATLSEMVSATIMHFESLVATRPAQYWM